jgi:hypothetical protein
MVRQLRLYALHIAQEIGAHSAGSRIEAEYIPPSSGIQEGLRAGVCSGASSERISWDAPTTVGTNAEIPRNT